MNLRDALDDFERHRGDPTRFPGERRTTSGRFSGLDGRTVHVEADGTLRDFSYPLVGRTGLARSRFGVRPADAPDADPTWFDADRSSQRYRGDTALVVTDHETPYGTVSRSDLTLGDHHVTHVDVGEADVALDLVCHLGFAPDGRDTRIAQLHHGDAVEVYHAEEVDYLASDTGFETVRGEPFVGFESVLDAAPADGPGSVPDRSSDEGGLSGDVVCVVPVENGEATLATLVTSRSDRSRGAALAAVRSAADDHDAGTLRRAAAEQVAPVVAADLPYADAVAADLRVLSLLTGATGMRVAGPDFDPYYAHSGGYGYVWFRDDAEISRFLLRADRRFGLGLDDRHARSAAAFEASQLEDGSWPHRLWAFDGSLAPGWANARLEAGGDVEYQADQTASVAAFLADADEGVDGDVLAAALDALDDDLADDGRPVTCQNAWEDMSGRFTHTAATFLDAYAALAATDVDGVADRAAERADAVYDALDDLWVSDRGSYALREYGDGHEATGSLDTRLDSATFALADAHRSYARVGDVDAARLDRLVSHVETVATGLFHESDRVAGLVRYEGDTWRRREQDREKIWSVSTVWGAHAAATLAAMLGERDDDRADAMASRARDLLALVLPDGPLCLDSGYLPEQVFDDGTPDSATPLGWPHSLRLATIALLDERGLLDPRSVTAD